MMKTIGTQDSIPWMTEGEIREQSDLHLLNGIGFAIANSGLDKTNELASLLGAAQAERNVLEAVQNIVKVFKFMDVQMDLRNDKVFTVKIEISTSADDSTVKGSHTIQ